MRSIDTRTFATYAEAQEFLDSLPADGWRVVGAPGTDTWLADREDTDAVIQVEVREP